MQIFNHTQNLESNPNLIGVSDYRKNEDSGNTLPSQPIDSQNIERIKKVAKEKILLPTFTCSEIPIVKEPVDLTIKESSNSHLAIYKNRILSIIKSAKNNLPGEVLANEIRETLKKLTLSKDYNGVEEYVFFLLDLHKNGIITNGRDYAQIRSHIFRYFKNRFPETHIEDLFFTVTNYQGSKNAHLKKEGENGLYLKKEGVRVILESFEKEGVLKPGEWGVYPFSLKYKNISGMEEKLKEVISFEGSLRRFFIVKFFDGNITENERVCHHYTMFFLEKDNNSKIKLIFIDSIAEVKHFITPLKNAIVASLKNLANSMPDVSIEIFVHHKNKRQRDLINCALFALSDTKKIANDPAAILEWIESRKRVITQTSEEKTFSNLPPSMMKVTQVEEALGKYEKKFKDRAYSETLLEGKHIRKSNRGPKNYRIKDKRDKYEKIIWEHIFRSIKRFGKG